MNKINDQLLMYAIWRELKLRELNSDETRESLKKQLNGLYGKSSLEDFMVKHESMKNNINNPSETSTLNQIILSSKINNELLEHIRDIQNFNKNMEVEIIMGFENDIEKIRGFDEAVEKTFNDINSFNSLYKNDMCTPVVTIKNKSNTNLYMKVTENNGTINIDLYDNETLPEDIERFSCHKIEGSVHLSKNFNKFNPPCDVIPSANAIINRIGEDQFIDILAQKIKYRINQQTR